MALTVTARGTGTNNSAATTLAPGGRSATIAAGSMGVLLMALDNAGLNGAVTCAPYSWTDAKGNNWTRQLNGLFDNGAASAGIESVIYTSPITTALLTTDAGTLTFGGGVSPTAKAWTWYEVTPSGGNIVLPGTAASGTGANAANGQITTASIAVGNAVVAGYFAEGVTAVTADADSTNGTWGTQQTATVGTTTSGVRVATQHKVQTTTPSTQSYDVTVAALDRIVGYIAFTEAATPASFKDQVTALSPMHWWRLGEGSGTLVDSIAGNNGTAGAGVTYGTAGALPGDSNTSISVVGANRHVTASAITLPSSGTFIGWGYLTTANDCAVLAVWNASEGVMIQPTTGGEELHLGIDGTFVVLTGYPSLNSWHMFAGTWNGTTASLYMDGTLLGSAAAGSPTTPAGEPVLIGTYANAGGGELIGRMDDMVILSTALTATQIATLYAGRTVAPAAGTTVTPSTAALTLTTYAPGIAVSNNQTVTPTTRALATATFAPGVTVSNHQLVTPTTLALNETTFAPAVSVGIRVVPAVTALATATFAATITTTNHQLLTPTTASLATATFVPAINLTNHQTVTPTTRVLVLAPFAPTILNSLTVTPATLALVAATLIPTVATTAHQSVTPTTAALTTTRLAPTIGLQVTATTRALVLTALAPTVAATAHQRVTPDVLALALATYAPVPTTTGGDGTGPPPPAYASLGPPPAVAYLSAPPASAVTVAPGG